MENKANTPKRNISNEKLSAFFITHLNRIYCAKSHLHERLPEILSFAHYTALKQAIAETLDDVERQISRMDQIYDMLEIDHGFENCQGVIGLIEDAFTAIYNNSDDPEMRDLSILFYLQNIESIEMASFKMLKLAAPVVGNKQIEQLLLENLDEAREDLALLRFITESYFRIE